VTAELRTKHEDRYLKSGNFGVSRLINTTSSKSKKYLTLNFLEKVEFMVESLEMEVEMEKIERTKITPEMVNIIPTD
jgi:hypothetical protein